MPLVRFIEASGEEHGVEATCGVSVMQIALDKAVPGIIADCGGAMSCATCHVYVDPNWADTVGGPSDQELSMLESAIDPRPNSRLSCQIVVSDALEGVVIRIPESQF